MRARHIILSVIAVASLAFTALPSWSFEIRLDHLTQSYGLVGLAELAPGDPVDITITRTNASCFKYNAEQVQATKPGQSRASAGLPMDTVKIPTTHQRTTASYTITIAKIQAAGCDADPRKEGSWTIPVVTLGWDIAVAGGPVVDGLTDKKYSLQPVSGQSGQFVVTADPGARDKTNQRLGAFLHLMNTDPRSGFRLGKDVSWAPISFGLGFDDKARYMFGTSLKFGDKWFLTVGSVLGKKSTLPVGVSEGMTTANQNLITTMGQKSAASWFVSLSFNMFQAKAQSAFDNLFPTPPKDQTGNQGQ